MSEPGLLHGAPDPAQGESLWEKAPAWRNLTVGASLLTLAAFALPFVPAEETVPVPQAHRIQAITASTRPAQSPAATAPATQETAPAAPAPIPQTRVAASPQGSHRAPAPDAAAPAQAQSQVALAMPAPQAQPDQSLNVCQLTWPTSPGSGTGIVMSFYDRVTALNMIPLTEAQNHGKIDPDYMDNLRVQVRLPDGKPLVALVPKTMTVHVGDHVTFQGGYRNTNLPCNYIPSLLTADLGPPPGQAITAPPQN